MSTVYVSYYVWKVSGKRKSSPGSKFNIYTAETPENKSEGDFSQFLVPSFLSNLPLAFVSVSGSANGHYVIGNYPNPSYIPTPSDPPPPFDNPPPPADTIVKVNVGKTDIHVTVWYLPVGPGGEGVYIDSFNVDTGEFFYDPNIANDFVTISPDQGLSAAANDLGFVPTTSAETITSNAQILSVPFLNWTVMSSGITSPKPVVNGKSLKVSAHSTVAAIAFFGTQNKHKPLVSFADLYAATWHRLYPGEEVDAPKPGDPGPGWQGAIKQLAVLLAMHDSLDQVPRASLAAINAQLATSVQTVTGAINKTVQVIGR
jgi:hypothetical protein